VVDESTKKSYRRLDVLAALNHVFNQTKEK